MPSIKFVFLLPLFLSPVKSFALDRTLLHNTSFDKTESRYPAVLEILESLYRIAPVRNEQSLTAETKACLMAGPETASIYGAIEPSQIKPLNNRPGPLFFNYFEKCAKLIAIAGFADGSSAKENSKFILGTELSNSLNAQSFSSSMAQLPQAVQIKLAERFLYITVGPDDVLRDFKYIGKENVFGANVDSTRDLAEFLTSALLLRYPNDTLLEFYTRFFTLIRLGPALRN